MIDLEAIEDCAFLERDKVLLLIARIRELEEELKDKTQRLEQLEEEINNEAEGENA